MNTVTIEGVVVADAVRRESPSGEPWTTFHVTTTTPDGTQDTVPVAWYHPLFKVDGGLTVRVEGKVSTRYFRVGGATQSRCEVVARKVRKV
jgi:hypothetical protein